MINQHPARHWAALFFGTCVLGCSGGDESSSALPVQKEAGAVDSPSSDGPSPSDSGCRPMTCAERGANCGVAPDGCGGSLSCGDCEAGMKCGGDGPNRCGTNCFPVSCEAAGATCGKVIDSCGEKLACGSCAPNTGVCVDNQCKCLGSEQCGNGVDDDCNGQIDEACSHNCMDDNGFGNCNTDMGYGDNCDDSDNTKSCEDYWFWGWCNRRKDYSLWVDAMRKWVDDRCDGAVSATDNDTNFTCTHSNGHVYFCDTPLVLVRQGAQIVFEASPHPFPMEGMQACYRVDWPSAETPWLVLDRDGDGLVGSGAELFGAGTVLASGRHARNGFEALAELDLDRDGWVGPRDPAWHRLRAWADRNGDRVSQPEELITLDDWGATAVSLQWHLDIECDERANCGRESADLRYVDGAGHPRMGRMVDVHLPVR